MKSKSLFSSRTFWGIVLTLLVAILPKIQESIDSGFDSKSIVAIFMALAGSGLAIAGRIDASQPIHTPDWMPGPNKEDFDESN